METIKCANIYIYRYTAIEFLANRWERVYMYVEKGVGYGMPGISNGCVYTSTRPAQQQQSTQDGSTDLPAAALFALAVALSSDLFLNPRPAVIRRGRVRYGTVRLRYVGRSTRYGTKRQEYELISTYLC
ncbi:hypothetical protein M5D96_010996 [Drosophila gunungcola]|uniref:Uncharacterized protein n=1 Tax=Drosophila gunungcola TaxID=103775 RepID=A0A9P9YFZ2_9MUSC|nr:hypothetical protein M5D96_010996 [Drosophila gunungcola]